MKEKEITVTDSKIIKFGIGNRIGADEKKIGEIVERIVGFAKDKVNATTKEEIAVLSGIVSNAVSCAVFDIKDNLKNSEKEIIDSAEKNFSKLQNDISSFSEKFVKEFNEIKEGQKGSANDIKNVLTTLSQKYEKQAEERAQELNSLLKTLTQTVFDLQNTAMDSNKKVTELIKEIEEIAFKKDSVKKKSI